MLPVVVHEHVRPVGPVPRSGLWPLVKVVVSAVELSCRFLAACLVGRGTYARANRYIDIFQERLFRWGNARLVVEGREHFGDAPVIVMSNHTSLLDIPSLVGAVPGPLRMVFKQELARIPIFGWALVAAGFIPIARQNHGKALEQLEVAKRVFAKGVSVWVSPEGTRFRGQPLPFKKGGFHLAKQLGAPIVPAFIEGAASMCRPDSLMVVQDGEVRVRFGPPIPTAGRDVDDVLEETRRAIEALGRSSALAAVQTFGRPSEKRSPSAA